MFKFTLHIVLSAIFLGGIHTAHGETTLNNTGGQIINEGIIRVKSGQVKALPDTLGGRVEFTSKKTEYVTKIPNIVFGQLIFSGENIKYIDTTNRNKPLVARDSLVVHDNAELQVHIIGADAQKTFKNDSKIKGKNDIRLINETESQNMLGAGKIDRLNIDNPNGVDVQENGQTINEKLTLSRGQLRNTQSKNVSIEDSATITRYPQGSIAVEPDLKGRVNVQYVGSGSITSGPEIPNAKDRLYNLSVVNSDSLILSKSATVNNELNIATKVVTGNDTLTHANAMRINYDQTNPNSEIDGTLRKSAINPSDTILLNNPYTYVALGEGNARNQTAEVVMTTRAKNYPPTPDGSQKTERYADLKLLDNSGSELVFANNIEFSLGFGWRYSPTDAFDETHSLIDNLNELLLQRWQGTDWIDFESRPASLHLASGWASLAADRVNSSGLFAVGMPSGAAIVFRAKALMEGPYVENTFGIMRTDLQLRGHLSASNLPAKTDYPYNLDANYNPEKIKALPDSIVDFIVLEFRKERNSEQRFFKTVLMRYDGTLIDLNGKDFIKIARADGIDSAGGAYYVALKHRNHSTIITESPLLIVPENNSLVYDFSDPSIIEGRISALKLVYYLDGARIYAMRAGYNANDPDTRLGLMNALNNPTETPDHILPWNDTGREGYLYGDYNLDGLINTRDFNISWNNRRK